MRISAQGKKKAVSRPILPVMVHPAAVSAAGFDAMFSGCYLGKFYGEKCDIITQQNQMH